MCSKGGEGIALFFALFGHFFVQMSGTTTDDQCSHQLYFCVTCASSTESSKVVVFQQLMLIRCGDSWGYFGLLQSMRKRKKQKEKEIEKIKGTNNTNTLMKM